MSTLHIEVRSYFTTNILIRYPDGLFEYNPYQDIGKFVGMAILQDEITKSVKRLRFESETFLTDKLTSEAWRQFHTRCEKAASEHIKEATAEYLEAKLITL